MKTLILGNGCLFESAAKAILLSANVKLADSVDDADVVLYVLESQEVDNNLYAALQQDLPVVLVVKTILPQKKANWLWHSWVTHLNVCHVYETHGRIQNYDGDNAIYACPLREIACLLPQWKASLEARWRLM